MTATTGAATLAPMTSDEHEDARGAVFAQRMDELGFGVSDLANAVGKPKSRGTIYRLRRGKVGIRDTTWHEWFAYLDRLERGEPVLPLPAGLGSVEEEPVEEVHSTESHLTEVVLDGVFGINRAVVRAPSDKTPAEIGEYVGEVLRQIRLAQRDQAPSEPGQTGQ